MEEKTKLHALWEGGEFLQWYTVSLDVVRPGYSMCGPQNSRVGITWELARNVDSKIPSQTYWIRIYILTIFPGYLYTLQRLGKKTVLKHSFSPGWCGSNLRAPTCEPKGPGSIPNQGTCLGCGPGPQLGAGKRQPHIDVSLPLFLPVFPSLKINKIFYFLKKAQLYSCELEWKKEVGACCLDTTGH